MIFPACSVDVDGSNWNLDTTVRGGFDYDYTAEKTIRDEVSVQDHTRIIVSAISGEINLEGQEDVDRVMIRARLSVGSSTQADADWHLDDLNVRISDGGDEILIETIQPQRSYGRGYRVEYDIIIPENLDFTATQDDGGISVYDLISGVDVSNVNGDLHILNVVGDIWAKLVNGSIEAEAILTENGVLDLATVNGRIVLNIPTITSANFSAGVENVGTVSVSNLVFTDLSSTPKSFEGTLGDGDGSISLRTDNGDIRVFGFEL
jgi:hypothetical protein